MRKRLWPDDTFVDFDHGLNTAINKLRETLGDTADRPRYVETVPRRGYGFIGVVEAPAEVRLFKSANQPGLSKTVGGST